jgi:hypothetical protein
VKELLIKLKTLSVFGGWRKVERDILYDPYLKSAISINQRQGFQRYGFLSFSEPFSGSKKNHVEGSTGLKRGCYWIIKRIYTTNRIKKPHKWG